MNDADDLGADYLITFKKFPVLPHENNVYSHTGNPNVLDFSCDGSELTSTGSAVGAYCRITDTQASSIREYATCSNRG